MPRLKDNGSAVQFPASAGRGLGGAEPSAGAGPHHRGQVRHPEGDDGARRPRAREVRRSTRRPCPVRAARRGPMKYQIEVSTDGGKTWQTAGEGLEDHRAAATNRKTSGRRASAGVANLDGATASRFKSASATMAASNMLVARSTWSIARPGRTPTKVTFAWTDDHGPRMEAHTFAPGLNRGRCRPERT